MNPAPNNTTETPILAVDDEDECRVCRGEAEEGRPLIKPCKCSGSIGLTHQDCLQSWLEVQRGDGCCELCKTKFRFAPLYAENAPDHLPIFQVLVGLSRRALARWLPLLFRSALAVSLWLIVAPLATAYLYQGWVHRPSSVMERLQWDLMTADLVSGAVVAGCIIVSFLAIMSFADFLRVEWQQPRGRRQRLGEAPDDDGQEGEQNIDDKIIRYVARLDAPILRRPETLRDERLVDNDDGEVSSNKDSSYADSDDSWIDGDEVDEDDMHEDEALQNAFQQAHDEDDLGARIDRPAQRQLQNDGRFDAMGDDDPGDMDINIALDELLGVRGPLSAVVRNLMWLLAFNTAYLGFFVFTPRVIGTAVNSAMFNISLHSDSFNASAVSTGTTSNMTTFSLIDILSTVEYESARTKTIFRLHDAGAVCLGYLSCASAVMLLKAVWLLSQKARLIRHDRNRRGAVHDNDGLREALDEMHRLLHEVDHDQNQANAEGPSVVAAIGVALDAMTAIVKVCVLLFLKMFMLPIILGVLLDISTLSLVGATVQERVLYAGRDLFSIILLHWVAGITFMLLVTVSVLQLREVVHPGLLAQVIRPQEPQPDLLGNLLNETAWLHAQRLFLSFIVYSVLLVLYVYFPAKIVVSSGLSSRDALGFKFSYFVLPQLQIPLELLTFHLCVLALLERYKNSIGEVQHYWLKFVSTAMKIDGCLLPKSVASFRLIGSLAIFSSGRIKQFWYEVANAKSEKERETIISARLGELLPCEVLTLNAGETKPNGERVLRFSSDFIRLPGRALRSRSVLVPTKTGRYRLKIEQLDAYMGAPYVQIWEEVHGDIIPRPPEGWDDLGAGGADEQGRWAWEKEKKSTIENGVATRYLLFEPSNGFGRRMASWAKIWVLIIGGWLATTVIVCVMLAAPLAIGRFLYYVLRVPENYIHDPFGFAIGSLVFVPCLCVGARFVATDASVLDRLCDWIGRFHRPPLSKTLVLHATAVICLGVCPVLAGTIYELAFVKSGRWYAGDERWINVQSVFANWLAGGVFLAMWAVGCFVGFLTRRFWAACWNYAAGHGNRENEGDEQAAAWQLLEGNHLRLGWQGRYGRVGRFLECLRSSFFEWEWDKIDRVVLLDDCAFPLLRELVVIFTVPAVFLCLCDRYVPLDGFGRAVVVRTIIATVSAVRTGFVWKHQVARWFSAAHNAARDDQYLIGEVLMNHDT